MSCIQIIFLKRALAIIALLAVTCGVLLSTTNDSTVSLAATLPVSALVWKWWRCQLKNIFRVKKFACVIPGMLYRSGQISRYRIRRTLDKHGIRTVVDLTESNRLPDSHQRAEEQVIADLDLEGHRYPMRGDGTGHISAVLSAVAAIHRSVRNRQPVLVHCAAGIQRTGHVIAVYLLLVEKMPPGRVLAHLEEVGWNPRKDTTWARQMNERMANLAILLQQRGVIDRLPDPVPRLPLAGLQPGKAGGVHGRPAGLGRTA